jgi:hypothetical protein
MVAASLKARVGREKVEYWRIVAYSPASRSALLRLRVNEHLCVQGVGSVSAQRINGDVVLVHTAFAEHVLPLRAGEALDD